MTTVGHYAVCRPVRLAWFENDHGEWHWQQSDNQLWEVVCAQCGDSDGPPDLEPAEIQQLRGPYPHEHAREVVIYHAAGGVHPPLFRFDGASPGPSVRGDGAPPMREPAPGGARATSLTRTGTRASDRAERPPTEFGEHAGAYRTTVPSVTESQKVEQVWETPSLEEIPVLTKSHVAAMEVSDDDMVWVQAGMHHLMLRTIGRRSGTEHKVALPFWRDPSGLRIVAASFAGAPSHPSWYLNLSDRTANPEVLCRVQGGSFWSRHVILEGDEYAEAWAGLNADRAWYND